MLYTRATMGRIVVIKYKSRCKKVKLLYWLIVRPLQGYTEWERRLILWWERRTYFVLKNFFLQFLKILFEEKCHTCLFYIIYKVQENKFTFKNYWYSLYPWKYGWTVWWSIHNFGSTVPQLWYGNVNLTIHNLYYTY